MIHATVPLAGDGSASVFFLDGVGPSARRYRGDPGGTPGEREPVAFLSAARAGDMKNPAARASLARKLGINSGRFRKLRQIHSRIVVADPFREQDGDGIITIDPSAVPVVTVADCLPIFLVHPESGAFGVVHSGWKGTGIAVDAVDVLVRRFGAKPGDVRVIVGPGIGGCCYDVPEERARNFSMLGERVVQKRNGSWFLDLAEANRIMLDRAGVGEILTVKSCTSCDARLGSYRRQGPGEYTHMLAGIGYF